MRKHTQRGQRAGNGCESIIRQARTVPFFQSDIVHITIYGTDLILFGRFFLFVDSCHYDIKTGKMRLS